MVTCPHCNHSFEQKKEESKDHPGLIMRLTALTYRQHQVLGGIQKGKTNKTIATELGLSEKTVKAHVTAILKVLQVSSRTQAVIAIGPVSHAA